MPVCYSCHVKLPSIRSLFVHFEIKHRISHTFKCGENLCLRKFNTKNSFRKHLQTTHKFPLIHPIKEKNFENLCNNSEGTSKANFNSTDNESYESEMNNNVELVTFDTFSSSLRQSVDLFVAKLYINPHFPRNVIQKVVIDSSLMVGSEWHF